MIKISKSEIAAIVFISLGPIKKILYSSSISLNISRNRTESINEFLSNMLKKFPLGKNIFWKLGIEGSGILIRLLDIEIDESTSIDNTILWEIKQNIPYALTSSHYRYKILKKKNNKIKVLVVILKKDFLFNLLQFLEEHDIQLESVYVLSLQLAHQNNKKSYFTFHQASDYAFFSHVKEKKLEAYQINHESNSNKSWEEIQKQYDRYIETSKIIEQNKIYKYQENKHLTFITNKGFLTTTSTKLSLPQTNLSENTLKELLSLLNTNSFSVELLPEVNKKKADNTILIWRFISYFILFQFFTPGLYLSLSHEKNNLIRNTNYPILPFEIRKLKKSVEDSKKVQQEIKVLFKLIKKTTFSQSEMLKSIALKSMPNMAITRIKGKKNALLINGLALSIDTISLFMQELEEVLEYGKLSLKTDKKGEAVSFTIHWRKELSQ